MYYKSQVFYILIYYPKNIYEYRDIYFIYPEEGSFYPRSFLPKTMPMAIIQYPNNLFRWDD